MHLEVINQSCYVFGFQNDPKKLEEIINILGPIIRQNIFREALSDYLVAMNNDMMLEAVNFEVGAALPCLEKQSLISTKNWFPFNALGNMSVAMNSNGPHAGNSVGVVGASQTANFVRICDNHAQSWTKH